MKVDCNLKHSKLGIVSFVIFLIYFVIFSYFSLCDISKLLGYSLPKPSLRLFSIEFYILLSGFVLLNFIGTILGLIAVIRHGTKKVFAYLGLILNGLIFMLFLQAVFT